MAAQRIVITGKTLDDIAARVREEHGPRARIVEASRVTSGGLGIAGLFQRRYVEATVELPERGRRAAGRPATEAPPQVFEPTPAQRVGLAALLADAESADEGFDGILTGASAPPPAAPPSPAPPSPAAPPSPSVSTRSDAFAELMDDLAFNGVVPAPAPAAPAELPAAPSPGGGVSRENVFSAPTGTGVPARAASAPAPALLDGPGDLIVVLGERPDVLDVAQAIADGSTGSRPSVRVAGTAVNGRFVAVDDRRSALDARAAGVELDRATIVALGWDGRAPGAAAAIVEALGADQVLIAVDAGRKHADTERWIAAATASIAADGLAVHGLAGTSTPETVEALPLPPVWQDA